MGEPRATVSIKYSYYEKLKEIQRDLGLPSIASTIYFLIRMYEKKEGGENG